jgi:hypothetical protein
MQPFFETRVTTQAAQSNAELRAQAKADAQAAVQDARNAARDAQNQARDAVNQARDAIRAAQDAARASGSNSPVIVGIPPVPPVPPFPDGGFTGQPVEFGHNDIPPQAVDMAIGFFIMCAVIVIGWPLARAFGKRIERRSEVPVVNPAMADQLQRIEQAVDAMAIEIERISESQRFMARLQNEKTPERVGLPADRS